MMKFKEPEVVIVRFNKDVLTESNDCKCDFGGVQMGDDEYCTGGTGEGGDVQCIITAEQGNC